MDDRTTFSPANSHFSNNCYCGLDKQEKRQEKRRAFLSRYHSWEAKDSHRFLSSNVGSSWSILDIKWPGSLTQIGEYSQMLQGNVFQIAPIQCLFENLKVNAFGSLYAILALNATAIIVAAAVYGIKKLTLMRNTLSGEVKVKEMSQTKEVIYRNLFFFLHVTYLSTCLKTANVLPLACHTICVDEEDEACEKFLKADYSIDCASSEFNRSVFVAYCTVAYIVFLPTSFLIILWRQRSYQKQERGLSTSVSLQNREVLTGLRFLFENYTEQTWYWELVETIRKVVLTSGLILVGS